MEAMTGAGVSLASSPAATDRVHVTYSITPSSSTLTQYSSSAVRKVMNSASISVVNGMNATSERKARCSQVTPRDNRSMKFSCVCCPTQKMPSVRKLSR